CTAVHGCKEDQEGKIWALVAAGSDDWGDYRHQADALHAYQVLIKRGIPAENIVTLIADTLAHNKENPYPGKVFNTPAKVDVYAGAKIDYSGDAVTPANFLAALSGNKSAVEGGNGRVIESGPNDRIFVYFVDHGSVGSVVFPADTLTRYELLQTLREMHSAKKYKQLTFYMETCHSGSMFEGSDADKLNVYAMTAVNATVDSYGTYCDVVDGLPCLGDVFSVNWMADTEQHADETLQQQYETVRNKSWTEVQQEDQADEPVCQWGDLSIAKQPISDFVGKGKPGRRDFEE
ncbi:Peptidase C13 family protein, partial [Aphelenchoides avenae]